jgi:hypothetical protein
MLSKHKIIRKQQIMALTELAYMVVGFIIAMLVIMPAIIYGVVWVIDLFAGSKHHFEYWQYVMVSIVFKVVLSFIKNFIKG